MYILIWFFFLVIEERCIIIIGKFGLGKSYSGNGILGKYVFESKCLFKLVIKECVYGLVIRNGLFFWIYDILGINLLDEVDLVIDIKWCLYCIFLGFYVIVLVMFGLERIMNEDMKMFKDFDSFLGVSVFKYLIFVVFKLENDEKDLYWLISEFLEMVSLNFKCSCRYVIFGNNLKEIFSECIGKFDDIFNEFVKENVRDGNEYFKYRFYDKVI